MQVVQSVVIDGTMENVYKAFYDLSLWPVILPDTKEVNIIYDDAFHQEFTMAVERPNGIETIRGIRYCFINDSLELFQPLPPPGFKRMTGLWQFKQKSDNQIEVKATRYFQACHDQDQEGLASRLTEYLHKNLNLFKKAIENGKL